MSDFFKGLKSSVLITSLLTLALGIVLAVYPTVTARAVCYLIGAVTLVYGIIHIIEYFRNSSQSYFRAGLFIGLVACAIGLFVILRSDVIISIIPVIFGLYMIIDGFMNFQKALNLKNMGFVNWGITLALAILSVILGVVLLFNPFTAAAVGMIFIGICLIYNSIMNIITLITLSVTAKKFGRIEE